MSTLSAQAIREFQEIYLAENGVELSNAEATTHANVFITLFDRIYSPLEKDWVDQVLDTPTLA